jgi:GNAT superfamily N-acetyltransferase
LAEIRPATGADAAAVADIDLAARRAALPTVRWAHDEAEVRLWSRDILIPGSEVVIAALGDERLGYLALGQDFVEQLYIHPDHWRQGIGSALLNWAKAARPDGLKLWCFQQNHPARAFYELHGFVAVAFSDGSDNEEREPDVLYAWTGLESDVVE